MIFLTGPRTCAEQGHVFEAAMEAWFRVTESTTSLVTGNFSQWIRFFCGKSYFTSQGQTLFPPRSFFEPLWRGCNISCFYNLICSQFLSCGQQQGAQHGLNTQAFTLICRRILHPALSFGLLLRGLMLLQWNLHCTAVTAQTRIVFGEKQINIENAYMPHRVCSQSVFMHACDLP